MSLLTESAQFVSQTVQFSFWADSDFGQLTPVGLGWMTKRQEVGIEHGDVHFEPHPVLVVQSDICPEAQRTMIAAQPLHKLSKLILFFLRSGALLFTPLVRHVYTQLAVNDAQ